MNLIYKARSKPKTTAAVLTFVAILAIGYVLAPLIAKYYLNNYVLKDMGDYTGHVDAIDLNLFDGAYNLKDLLIVRKGGNEEVPFFHVDDFWVSISWSALKESHILIAARLKQPELNFLDAKKEGNRQAGAGTNWIEVFEELIPTTLHRLDIENGAITFQNFDTEPKVDIRLTSINAWLTNLTNVRDRQGSRVATAELEAVLLDEAEVFAKAKFNPFDYENFTFAANAKNIQLRELNDFSRVYANIDFEDGDGDIFTEIKAKDGKLSGYVKPLFSDVNILSWEQDIEKQHDNPLQILWESGVGFVKTLLTNVESDRVGTKVEIDGNIDNTDISAFQALIGLVKNAFVDSLSDRFDKYTSLTKETS